jgi:uncharacterized protein (DUF4415 family)
MRTIRTKKSKTKKPLAYGNVDVPAEAFLPKNVKERITMMVDQDVLQAFKAAAAKRGNIGYQTLINEKLRESLPGLDKTLADRIADLERIIADLAPVLKKRA